MNDIVTTRVLTHTRSNLHVQQNFVPIQLPKPAKNKTLNMAFVCSKFISLCHSYRESSHHLHFH